MGSTPIYCFYQFPLFLPFFDVQYSLAGESGCTAKYVIQYGYENYINYLNDYLCACGFYKLWSYLHCKEMEWRIYNTSGIPYPMCNDIPDMELKYRRRAPSTADVGQQLPYKECNSICDGKKNENTTK